MRIDISRKERMRGVSAVIGLAAVLVLAGQCMAAITDPVLTETGLLSGAPCLACVRSQVADRDGDRRSFRADPGSQPTQVGFLEVLLPDPEGLVRTIRGNYKKIRSL